MSADMTTTAQDRAQQIRDGLATVWNLLLDAYAAEDWKELGYPSWDAYCSEELQGRIPRLAKSERGGVVQELAEHGMPIKAIAAATGIARNTVRADLRAAEEQTAGGHFDPAPVKGATERPATYRKPEPPHTVNTDTGEVIDKATGEVITHLPDHDAVARETNAIENVAHMTDTLRRLSSLRTPEYRARLIENNAAHPDHEDPAYTQHFNPQGIRDLADLLNTLAAEMENAS